MTLRSTGFTVYPEISNHSSEKCGAQNYASFAFDQIATCERKMDSQQFLFS